MLGFLSLDIVCSSKLTVFLELRSRETRRFSEYLGNFRGQISEHISAQMEAIAYINSWLLADTNKIMANVVWPAF